MRAAKRWTVKREHVGKLCRAQRSTRVKAAMSQLRSYGNRTTQMRGIELSCTASAAAFNENPVHVDLEHETFHIPTQTSRPSSSTLNSPPYVDRYLSARWSWRNTSGTSCRISLGELGSSFTVTALPSFLLPRNDFMLPTMVLHDDAQTKQVS